MILYTRAHASRSQPQAHSTVTVGVRSTLICARFYVFSGPFGAMSSSDRPSSPWPRSKVGPPRPEQPAAAKCATRLSLRTSRPPASTPRHSSLAVTHLLTPTFLSVRRCRGSIFRFKAHEKRGISSSIGIQIWFFVITLLMRNSSLTLPACAAAQVGVDFLDGEKWALSTSFSTLGIWIFDSLFDPVDVVSQEGLDRSAVEAFFEYPRLVPILAYPCPSRTPDSCPPADSVWPRFTCPCTQDSNIYVAARRRAKVGVGSAPTLARRDNQRHQTSAGRLAADLRQS